VRGRVGTPWAQYVGLFVLAVATVALCYLAVAGMPGGDDEPDTADDPLATSSVSGGPTGEPTAEPSGGTATPTSSPTDEPTAAPTLSTPPTVPDQRRVDFTKGDDLPDGAVLVDGGGNTSGLTLTRKGLTHGRPTDVNVSGGLVETKLESDVRSLGVRVRFADENSGAVSLVAWQTSIAARFEAGTTIPPATGMQLIARPGEWTLSVLDDEERVLAEGTYDATSKAETFTLVRDGSQLFVIDPTGATTIASDPSVAELSGPWASWGVVETALDQTPAVVESLWGG
jgi:hypothetical protein